MRARRVLIEKNIEKCMEEPLASHTEYYKLKEGNLEKLWYVKLRMFVCRHIRSVEPSAKYSRNQ